MQQWFDELFMPLSLSLLFQTFYYGNSGCEHTASGSESQLPTAQVQLQLDDDPPTAIDAGQ